MDDSGLIRRRRRTGGRARGRVAAAMTSGHETRPETTSRLRK